MLRRKKKAAEADGPPKPQPPWVPWAAIGGAALILVMGLVVIVGRWVGSSGKDSSAPSAQGSTPTTSSTIRVPAGADDTRRKNAIANAPMYEGDSTNEDPTNFQPKPEVNATTPPLSLPSGGKSTAGVTTGFAHTPEGALAQLAALNIAAYSNLSVDAGRSAYQAFAMPGAVALQDWNPTKTVMRYYTDNPKTDPSRMRATFTPVQGLVKGSVGTDWALVCVNGQVNYAYNGDSNRVAVWDCARMQWNKDKWMLAPGGNPARAPLTWPRDALSYQAGFRDLQNTPS